MTSLLDAALAHAAAGFHVFPCVPNGKTPAVKGGFTLSTTNPDTIREWWEKNPDYNIGIATGLSGLLVVDLDDKNGKTGSETWATLPGTPQTYEVRTPSGGRHLYFDGEGRSTSESALGPGIDTRGRGGYVLAPPSVVGGRHYEVASGSDIAPLPQWLGERVLVAARRAPPPEELMAPSIDDVRDALEHIQNGAEVDFATWKATGGMLHAACGGNVEWRELFHEWSRQWPGGYDAVATERTCDQVEGSPYTSVGWEALQGKTDAAYQIARIARLGAALGEATEHGSAPHPETAPEAPPLPDRFRFIGLTEPKPMDWLIDGMFERGSLSMMYGPSFVGKTYAALDMALSVATGTEYAGKQVKPGPVIYLAGEGHNGILRRATAWAMERGVDLSRPAPWAPDLPAVPFFCIPAVRMLDEGDWRALVVETYELALALHGKPPALIVFDTLARCFGDGDENATKDMNAFVNALRTFQTEFNATCLVLHHTGEGAPNRPRGSGALRAATDSEFQIKNEGEGVVKLITTKQKEGEAGEELHFLFKSHMLGEDKVSTLRHAEEREAMAEAWRNDIGGDAGEIARAVRDAPEGVLEADLRSAMLQRWTKPGESGSLAVARWDLAYKRLVRQQVLQLDKTHKVCKGQNWAAFMEAAEMPMVDEAGKAVLGRIEGG